MSNIDIGSRGARVERVQRLAVDYVVSEVRFVNEASPDLVDGRRNAFRAALDAAFLYGDQPATTATTERATDNDTLTLAKLAEAVSRLQPPIWYCVSEYIEPGAYIVVAGIVAQYFSYPDYLIIHPNQVDGFWADARASRVSVRPLIEWRPGMPFARLREAAQSLAQALDTNRTNVRK